MTTSQNIAGPTDDPKRSVVAKKEAEDKKKLDAVEIADLEKLAKKIDDVKKVDNVKKEEEKVLTLTPDQTVNDDYIEVDWNKVQVIEDIKIILQKLNVRFDPNYFESDDPIRRYLKD
jgi:hypothetical protein